MNVLFLDIDGVLNCERTRTAFKGFPQDFEPRSLAMFDQVAINLLRGLCARAGLSVVVSSSWRITHHWDVIGRNLDLPTIDRTPSLTTNRGGEIQHWLDRHPEVERYAIVDDDPDMLPEQRPFFVQTCGFDGLRWADFSKLCSLFSIAPYDCAPGRPRVVTGLTLRWGDE